MNADIVKKLEKEIKWQYDQFDFLFEEHFIHERYERSFYTEMIAKINKSKGKIEILLELLNE